MGFLDKNKTAPDTYNLQSIENVTFDTILIYNDLFFNEIYREIKDIINADRIYRVGIENSHYILYDKYQILIQNLKTIYQNSKLSLYKNTQKSIAYLYDLLSIKRTTTLFVAKDSIGSNLKHLYLYYHHMNPQTTAIITNNKSELQELKKKGFNAVAYSSFSSYMYAALAKMIITEQVIAEYFDALSSQQKTLQLWHGISLKKLYPSTRISYNYFLGTSAWVNDVTFKNIFQATEFLTCGYPRNDVFFKTITKNDLLFCDEAIYTLVKYNFENNIRSILYMPTYRESAQNNTPPLDFELLNAKMKAINTFFIVKLHPFALEKFKTTLQEIPHLSHVIFYNTQGDIYPILKYTDMLVTDYSSIAFDFLLLDRLIIYFDYDYEHYLKTRGAFLLKYADYTPGIKVKTQDALTQAIVESFENNDTFKAQRSKLKTELFDHCDGNASQRIYELFCAKEGSK